MELLKGGGLFLKRGGGEKSCNENLVKVLTIGIALLHITINCDIYIIWNSQPVNFLLCQKERGRQEGEGRRGKLSGARAGLGPQNLDKTSGHWATVKRVGGP